MKRILFLPVLLLLLSIPALADVSPEGCYSLASGDTETNDAGHREICLESTNANDGGVGEISTGKFDITIRLGGEPSEVYHMTCSLTDGSGSHADFLFAEEPATLEAIENTDAYARGNAGPIKGVIYYILTDPELKGGDAIKSGERAGSATYNGKKYSLFKN